MPPQSRAAHVFAGVAVEIDLILKGIKTFKETGRASDRSYLWK